MRVLVVEDHKELAATIAVGLRREGWRSTSSSTATT
jgi:DNA-binding response OmpR family regulator